MASLDPLSPSLVERRLRYLERQRLLHKARSSLYAWKGTKWIRRIEFSDGDRPGFWEVRGYSNTAEPWYDDRFSG